MKLPFYGAPATADCRRTSPAELLREIARYLCGSPHSRWRQRAQLAELDRRLRNDIGLYAPQAATAGAKQAAPTPNPPSRRRQAGTALAAAGLTTGENRP